MKRLTLFVILAVIALTLGAVTWKPRCDIMLRNSEEIYFVDTVSGDTLAWLSDSGLVVIDGGDTIHFNAFYIKTDTSFMMGHQDSLVKPGVVIGSYNTAAGNYSFLFGLGNKSEPPFSTIFGLVDSILGTATYTKNTIFGSYNTINNKTRETVIVGYNNRADTSSYGAVLGHTCRLNNSGHGVAIGHNAVVDTSDYAICIGDDANVTMDYGIAIGHHAAVDDTGGIALGFRTCVSHPKSVVIGWQDTTTDSYQVKLGDEEYTTLIEGKADIAYMTADSLALTDTIVKFEQADSHLYITMSDGSVYQCVDTLEKWVSEARVDTVITLGHIYGMSFETATYTNDPNAFFDYWLLNSTVEWVGTSILCDGDSVSLDSLLVYVYVTTMPDADSIMFMVRKPDIPTGSYLSQTVLADTLNGTEIANGYTHIRFDIGLEIGEREKKKYAVLLTYLVRTAGDIRWGHTVWYYTAHWKLRH